MKHSLKKSHHACIRVPRIHHAADSLAGIRLAKEHQMKFATLGAAFVLSLAVIAPASAQNVARETQQMVAQATPVPLRGRVAAVDMATNTMIVKGPAGNEVRLPIVKRPDGVSPPAVGDRIELQYKDAIMVELDRIDSAANHGIRKRVDTDVFLPTASGYEVARQTDIEATIEAIDAKAHKVILRGARARFTVDVRKGVDVSKLRRGDVVHAVFVSTYAVQEARAGVK
jgi:hypothetical protein